MKGRWILGATLLASLVGIGIRLKPQEVPRRAGLEESLSIYTSPNGDTEIGVNKDVRLSQQDKSLLESFTHASEYSLPPIDVWSIERSIAYIFNPGIYMHDGNTKYLRGEGRGLHIGNGLVLTAYHVVEDKVYNQNTRSEDRIIIPHPDMNPKPYTFLIYIKSPHAEIAILKVPEYPETDYPLLNLALCDSLGNDNWSYFIEYGKIGMRLGADDASPQAKDDRPTHVPVWLGQYANVRIQDKLFNLREFFISDSDALRSALSKGDSGIPIMNNDHALVGLISTGPLESAFIETDTAPASGTITDACMIREVIRAYLKSGPTKLD